MQKTTETLKSGIDVRVQDQTSPLVDLFFHLEEGSFTLSSSVAVDDTTFDTAQAASISAGDIVCFQEGSRFMQAIVLSVSAPTVTIDTPFDYAYTASSGCTYGSKNLNVDGSSTPAIFRISPKNLSSTKWDIVRVIFSMTDATSMDDGKFGGGAALTNGIVLRVKDGVTKNIFNVKTNGDFALRAYDAAYVDDTLGPGGLFGFRCRRTFGGQSKNGVVIRLDSDTDDELEVIVQDNLTGLDSFNVVAQGHVVED